MGPFSISFEMSIFS